jgi:hypothetical protein
VPEEAPEEPAELPPDEAAAEGELPAEEEVLVVVVVVEVLDVVAGAAVIVAVGTLSAGAPEVSELAEPPPQAARPRHSATAATPAIHPDGPPPSTALRRLTARPQTSSGSMRRPQCGQSLRSFWHS